MSHSGNTESSDSDLKLFPRRLDLALDAVVSTQDTSDAEESGEEVSTVSIALPSLQYQVTLFLTSRSKSHQHKRTSLDSNRTYDCVMKRSTSSAKVYTRTLEEDDHSGEVDTDEEKCDEEVDEMTRERGRRRRRLLVESIIMSARFKAQFIIHKYMLVYVN